MTYGVYTEDLKFVSIGESQSGHREKVSPTRSCCLLFADDRSYKFKHNFKEEKTLTYDKPNKDDEEMFGHYQNSARKPNALALGSSQSMDMSRVRDASRPRQERGHEHTSGGDVLPWGRRGNPGSDAGSRC